MQRRTVDRQIAVAALTLGGAVGVFAIAFGVGAVAAGGSVAQACAMSLLVFTGRLAVQRRQRRRRRAVRPAAALGGAMLLAARNGVYGLAVSRVIRGSLATRLLAAQLVDRRDDGDGHGPARPARPTARVLGHRRRRCSCAGTSAR